MRRAAATLVRAALLAVAVLVANATFWARWVPSTP